MSQRIRIIRLFIAALLVTLGTQAWAECGNLCNEDWLKTATTSDVKAELDAGADVMARNENGSTPLHSAAGFGTPEHIKNQKLSETLVGEILIAIDLNR